MCSIAMPAELLLSRHAPPAYNPLLYSSLMVTTTPAISNISVNQKTIRPCLSSGSLEIDGLLKNADTDCCDSNKRKKKVVFADDRGRPLTQVRVMTEPSNVPPAWSSNHLAKILGRNNIFMQSTDSKNVFNILSAKAENNAWEAKFVQPASDYLTFRKKLDENSVCLENVIIRESEQCLVGTVKVKNLAYDKEIVVRTTSDNWNTHEDVHCTFVEQPGGNTYNSAFLKHLYDTFRFRLTLPPKSNNIQFCVRYSIHDSEYWDNNDGKNYVVEKKSESISSADRWDIMKKCSEFTLSDLIEHSRNATQGHMRSWSEFASWHQIQNDTPYW